VQKETGGGGHFFLTIGQEAGGGDLGQGDGPEGLNADGGGTVLGTKKANVGVRQRKNSN